MFRVLILLHCRQHDKRFRQVVKYFVSPPRIIQSILQSVRQGSYCFGNIQNFTEINLSLGKNLLKYAPKLQFCITFISCEFTAFSKFFELCSIQTCGRVICISFFVQLSHSSWFYLSELPFSEAICLKNEQCLYESKSFFIINPGISPHFTVKFVQVSFDLYFFVI